MIVMASIIFDVFASFLLKLSFLPNKTTFMFGINDFRTKIRWAAAILTIFGSFLFIVKLTVLYSAGS